MGGYRKGRDAVRTFLAVLLAFLVGVFVGRMIPVEDESAQAPERADAKRPGRPPPRLEPPDARPVPDPARDTPGPEVTARRRAPGAPARLPIDVEVVAPDGGVPANVTLLWARVPDARRFSRMGWKAPRTELFTEPGDVWIHATGGVHEGWRAEPVKVSLVRDAPKPQVRLRLRESPGIYGHVRLPGTFDRPRVQVRLERLAGSALPADFEFKSGGKRARPRARDGLRYAFTDLDPGYYAVALTLGGRDRTFLTKVVQVRRGMIEQDLVLDAFDPAEFMEVRVLGPDGEPLGDAHVATCVQGPNTSSAGGNIELRRNDGTFLVDHNPFAERDANGRYAEATYYVRVSSREYGEITLAYDPNARRPVVVRYGLEGTVLITLRDYAASLAAGRAFVGLRRKATGDRSVRNPKPPSADGELDFGEQQPGAYDLLLLGPDRRLRWVRDVEIRTGENRIDVQLPAFHALEIDYPPEVEKPRFSLTRGYEDGSSWTLRGEASEDRPGVHTFELLTAGMYSLEAWLGERRVLRDVTIPADRVLRLDG